MQQHCCSTAEYNRGTRVHRPDSRRIWASRYREIWGDVPHLGTFSLCYPRFHRLHLLNYFSCSYLLTRCLLPRCGGAKTAQMLRALVHLTPLRLDAPLRRDNVGASRVQRGALPLAERKAEDVHPARRVCVAADHLSPRGAREASLSQRPPQAVGAREAAQPAAEPGDGEQFRLAAASENFCDELLGEVVEAHSGQCGGCGPDRWAERF